MSVLFGVVTRRADGAIGIAGISAERSRGIGSANFGGWQERDIGKKVYRVGTTYQMENDEQRDARIRHGVG